MNNSDKNGKNITIKKIQEVLIDLLKFPIEQKTNNPKILFYNYEIDLDNYYCHSWKIYKETLVHEFIHGGSGGGWNVYPVMYYTISPLKNVSLKPIDCILIDNKWERITDDIKKTFLN
jgi:hypothetical protein